MDERLLVKEIDEVPNQEDFFSVKHFYDTFHLNAYIKPTSFTMNVSSSCPVVGLKDETIPPNASSSTFRGGRINSLPRDGQFFEITLAKCYANYLFALRLPHRVGVLLPSSNIMATFICNGKTYKVKFFGQRKIKMFGSGWRQFVEEHNLFEGDHLKFKVKERSDQKLELNVNILKCNVLGRLHAERRGTIERPINV